MNGGKTDMSLTFFMTNTDSGFLYHVKRWLAGSWIVLKNGKGGWGGNNETLVTIYYTNGHNRQGHAYMIMADVFMMRPHGPNCCTGLGAFSDRVLL